LKNQKSPYLSICLTDWHEIRQSDTGLNSSSKPYQRQESFISNSRC